MREIKVIDKAAFNKYIEARRDYRRYIKIAPQPEVAELKKKTVEALSKQAFPGMKALESAVNVINGRATAHTYSAGEIVSRLEDVELDLRKRGVTLANLVGTRVSLFSEVPTAKSYSRRSHTAIASHVTAVRRATGWYVEHISKTERYTGPGGSEKITPTIGASARADIVKAALEGLNVVDNTNPTIEW
jgi:hypothetical protein